MKTIISGVFLLLVSVTMYLLAETFLTISEDDDCLRLESQVQRGYIKSVPDWCKSRGQ